MDTRGCSTRAGGVRWLLLALALLAALPFTTGRAATTRTWTGATDTNWGTASNWSPPGAPAQGDILVFPAATPLSSTNNLTGLDLDSIVISGSHTIGGNSFTVDTAITVNGASPSFSNMILLGGGASVTVNGAASVLTLAGPLSLAGQVTVAGDGTTRAGDVTGGGGITEAGPGVLEYRGFGTYSGGTNVSAGTLRAAIDNLVSCTQGAGPTNRLPVAGAVSVATGAVLDLQCPVVIGVLGGSGEVRTEAASATLGIQSTADSLFAGAITGPGGLVVTNPSLGPSGVVLSGVSSYSGATQINGGRFALSGGSIAASGSAFVTAGGLLGGSGQFPLLAIGYATLFPGAIGSPGVVRTPSMTLTVQSIARFGVGSDDPSQYDQVVVGGGSVDLGDATLQLTAPFGIEPGVGSRFTIISGAGSLTNTFHNLPEGAVFTVGQRRYSITYRGGAGHDVIVTRLPSAPADLSITKTAAGPSVAAGGTLTFTLSVHNGGPSDAAQPVVADTIAPPFVFQSVTAPSGWTCSYPKVGDSTAVSCRAITMAANSDATFVITVTVGANASGDLTNSASVSSGADDAVTTNNSASATVHVTSGALPFKRTVAMVASDG